MPRRKPYTRLEKQNFSRPPHVVGKGDQSFRGFQCLNPNCTEHIFAPEPLDARFEISCPACGYVHESDGETKLFDYTLHELDAHTRHPVKTVDSGEFVVLHSEYIAEAERYKYCLLCSTLKPLSLFAPHGRRKLSGRQGECNLCKRIYNGVKNQTRLADQHREAAQKRRLYVEVSGTKERIDSKKIFDRFRGKCFKCGKDLVDAAGKPLQGMFNIDHTLPAFYLWPVSTETATLLCKEHNNEKKGKWPGEYYKDEKQIRALAVVTGLDYAVLTGAAKINPDALDFLRIPKNVDGLLTKYAKYRSDLIALRNRVLKHADLDIFEISSIVAQAWKDEANSKLSV